MLLSHTGNLEQEQFCDGMSFQKCFATSTAAVILGCMADNYVAVVPNPKIK